MRQGVAMALKNVQKQTRSSGGQNQCQCSAFSTGRVQKQTRSSGGQNPVLSMVSTGPNLFRSRPVLQGVKTLRRPGRLAGLGCSEADPFFRGSKRDPLVLCPPRPVSSEADPFFRGSKLLEELLDFGLPFVQKQTRSSGGQNRIVVHSTLLAFAFRSRPVLQGVKTARALVIVRCPDWFRSRPVLQGVKTREPNP